MKSMKIKLASKRIVTMFAMLTSLGFLSGCAQYAVTQHPSPFKPVASVVGANRIIVTGELGKPVTSEEINGRLIESYRYVDGGSANNGGMKACRFVLYCAGDLFTVFLDQFLTWPAETYSFPGTPHVVLAEYDKGNDGFWYVSKISDLKQPGAKWAEPTLFPPQPEGSQKLSGSTDLPSRNLWTTQ
jgi:hypothetical protein